MAYSIYDPKAAILSVWSAAVVNAACWFERSKMGVFSVNNKTSIDPGMEMYGK